MSNRDFRDGTGTRESPGTPDGNLSITDDPQSVTSLQVGPALLPPVMAALGSVSTRVERIAARPGVTVDWPDWVSPELVASVRAGGVAEPWKHQALAADAIHAGQHTVIATGTGSGKSLAYLMPSLTAILEQKATVLYVTPTKALAQDQLHALNDLGLANVQAATYDGDTPGEARPWIRQNANYILTNPEMIHRGILPNHASWRSFWKRLSHVIVDETHNYRGVFGTHMSALMRRLRRVAAHYEASPVFVAVSATMAQPELSASALFGVDVAAVKEDTSTRGEITLVLADPSQPQARESGDGPPVSTTRSSDSARTKDGTHPAGRTPTVRQSRTGGPAQAADHRSLEDLPPTEGATPQEAEESAFGASVNVLAALTEAGARSLGFIRARKGAEAMAEAVRGRLPNVLQDKVRAYRGGLLPEERRVVEADLRSGALRAVATTNALELGIDISGLDSIVVCGWPGMRSSFLQQIGRAGRNGEDALAVMLAAENPLDRYLVNNPDRILNEPLESATFDPNNPHVLLPHIAAAIGELPMTDDPAASFGPRAAELIELLVSKGWVRQRESGWFWTGRDRPAELADLRGSGRGPVAISEADTGRLLGTVDEASAPAQVHPGAVYRHQGASYVVEELDLDSLVAIVRPERPPFTTTAKSVTDLRILTEDHTEPLGKGQVSVGEVEVTGQVVGFIRKSLTGTFLGLTPLDMPETKLSTKAVWWQLSVESLNSVGLSTKDVPGAVHAAEHAAIGMLPGLATCDRWDLGGLSSAQHADTLNPTIFVYDGHPGGAGISQHGFAHIEEWLSATLSAIETCQCETGCPGCVQSPKCGNGNEPLDKAGAIIVLQMMLGEA